MATIGTSTGYYAVNDFLTPSGRGIPPIIPTPWVPVALGIAQGPPGDDGSGLGGSGGGETAPTTGQIWPR